MTEIIFTGCALAFREQEDDEHSDDEQSVPPSGECRHLDVGEILSAMTSVTNPCSLLCQRKQ